MTVRGMDHYAAALSKALEKATAAALSDSEATRPALMYSAGLDSATLAKVCQDAGYAPLLLSLGTDRSKDREFVERSRRHLDLPVRFITVSESDIARALPAVEELLQQAQVEPDIMHRSLSVGTHLLCQVARREGVGLLLSALGADALFAGFNKYRRLSLEELPGILEDDVQNAARRDFARDRTIASSFSLDFAAPFLTAEVVGLGLKIPAHLKLGPQGNKLVLREVARRRGLPSFLAERPKKAMQYSTGIERVIRDLQRD